ncbi:MAG: gliding motility protein GldL [Bacteroidia bacterium]
MGLISALQSKKGKKFMAYLYGWGASIVIVGAMFKIQHWPGASVMLVAGLSIEAIIFFFSAFEPIHEEIDWSLVYPELRGAHGHGEHDEHQEVEEKKSITEELDKMLEEAKIEPELLQSLGQGLRSLTEQTSKLNDISGAALATNEYVASAKNASTSLNKLSETYVKASESLTGLSVTNDDGATYGEQLQKVAKNLSALNAVYELQLQGTSEHLKATNQLYNNIEQLMANLSESVEDTKRYKENISELSKNLTALNTIYGNMLNAMNFRG